MNKLERVLSDKHTSLLDPFASYEENQVLWIWLGQYSQHFIFLRNLQMGPIN
jgi:hypothetical protein